MEAFDATKIAELKAFVTLVKSDSTILQSPELSFFADFMRSFGAKIPEVSTKGGCCSGSPKGSVGEAFSAQDPPKGESEDEFFDESIFNDDEVIGPEQSDFPPIYPVDPNHEKNSFDADPGKNNSEPINPLDDNSMDAISEKLVKLKASAAEFAQEGKLTEGVDCYTEAIMLGNPSALLYTRRAELLLGLKRPMAAIRDCDEALRLNPDSGRGYQFRGMAHRALGNWRQAHKDLDVGQKIDYDERFWEVQKHVDEKYRIIEAHDRKRLQKAEQRKKAKTVNAAPHVSSTQHTPPGGMPQMPGAGQGFDFGGGGGAGLGNMAGLLGALGDPELKEMMTNPKVQTAFQELLTNPAAFSKYQDDPEMSEIFAKLSSKLGSGMNGLNLNFSGGMPPM